MPKFKLDANMVVGQPYDMVTSFPTSPIWKPWNSRTEPCPGNENVALHDTPQSAINRTLKIDITVSSAEGCPCPNAKKTASVFIMFDPAGKSGTVLVNGQQVNAQLPAPPTSGPTNSQ